MTWDGQERRSGKDKRKTERRGQPSQMVTAIVGSANQRKHSRRAADRAKVAEPKVSELIDTNRWRDLRSRTVGKLPERPEVQKPSLRLIRGGSRD